MRKIGPRANWLYFKSETHLRRLGRAKARQKQATWHAVPPESFQNTVHTHHATKSPCTEPETHLPAKDCDMASKRQENKNKKTWHAVPPESFHHTTKAPAHKLSCTCRRLERAKASKNKNNMACGTTGVISEHHTHPTHDQERTSAAEVGEQERKTENATT